MDLKKSNPHSFTFPAARAALLCLCTLIGWCFFTVIQTKKTLDSIHSSSTFPNKTDRLLIFAPHPDDETIAAGGLIQKAVALKIPLLIIYLTYGDNNAWSYFWENKAPVTPNAMRKLGEQRRTEALSALKKLGVSAENVSFLGFPDFHTFDIFCLRWSSGVPLKTGFTNVLAVPYDTARIPGDPYTADAIMAQLKDIITQFKPTSVVLAGGHPADFNSDHRALYLFVHAALWEMERTEIKIFPSLIHYPHWPRPISFRPDLPMIPPDPWEGESWWIAEPLNDNEQTNKAAALALHASQYRTSAKYFRSFVRRSELFGDFNTITLKRSESAQTHRGVKTDKHSLPNIVTRLLRGTSSTSIARGEKDITVTISFSRPVGKQTAATIFLFGQRSGKPFTQTPKLRIRFGNLGYAVYDGAKKLPDKTIRIKRTLFSVSATVALSTLGEPQRLMLGVNPHILSAAPLDLTSWRIIELPE